MAQKIQPVDYAVVITGTFLSMSLHYQGFLESEIIPDKVYKSETGEQDFTYGWSETVLGESEREADKSEQIHLPDFKKKYKVKMRARDAGRLQPPNDAVL